MLFTYGRIIIKIEIATTTFNIVPATTTTKAGKKMPTLLSGDTNDDEEEVEVYRYSHTRDGAYIGRSSPTHSRKQHHILNTQDMDPSIKSSSSSGSSSFGNTISTKDDSEEVAYYSNEYNNELKRLENEIQHWKKFLNIANSSVLLFSFTVIILYFTTDVFPKPPKYFVNVTQVFDTMSDQCLNESIMELNDVESFMTCAGFCSDVSSCCSDNDGTYDESHITTIIEVDEPFLMNETSLLCEITNDEDNDSKDKDNMIRNHFPKQQCNQLCQPIKTTYMNHFSTYMSTICDKDTIEASDEAFVLCKERCKYFDCCFSVDDDVNCFGDKGSLCSHFFDSCVHVKENALMFGYGLGPQIIDPAD